MTPSPTPNPAVVAERVPSGRHMIAPFRMLEQHGNARADELEESDPDEAEEWRNVAQMMGCASACVKAEADRADRAESRAEELAKERDRLASEQIARDGEHESLVKMLRGAFHEQRSRADKAEAEVAELRAKLATPELIALGEAAVADAKATSTSEGLDRLLEAASAYAASVSPPSERMNHE